jgi:hypothetical protein
MKSTTIVNATRTIGEAQGYLGLAIRDVLINEAVNGPETPCMVTEWEPSPEELQALNRGARIYIQILGRSHPPIMVDVGKFNG